MLLKIKKGGGAKLKSVLQNYLFSLRGSLFHLLNWFTKFLNERINPVFSRSMPWCGMHPLVMDIWWSVVLCFAFEGGRINSRDVWIYNSQLNIWIRVASLNKGRWRHKMAVLLGKVRETTFFITLALVHFQNKYHSWILRCTLRLDILDSNCISFRF